MNDYMFTVEVLDGKGSYVRRQNIVVCADNVEVAYDKVIDKVSKSNDTMRSLVSAVKL